jgi:tRNA threonylcarbamoyladenosine biosynthesis protein TsaE
MGTERIFLPDDDATAALGARLAAQLKPGDLVLLEGGLGAGKTALARSIIRTLVGDPSLDVPSPSFALVQPYEAHSKPLLHADLYRITSPREMDELGLFDQADAIVLIEWPERAPELAAAMAAFKIVLIVPADGRGRHAEITS